jgi:copper chaperone CopZ
MKWTLGVEGMTCGGCGASVERVLKAMVPEARVSVHWATGRADVVTASLDEDEVRRRLEAAGFGLTSFLAET